ncbi:hypothetical protein BDW59DRAFT_142191 [Aspergillus cavernicola]|uniref:Uncharacterized protein n=1 Tax=Aspergillus cavernicola TaxID=176166 RepID=A0ABR4IPM5_9EURO
MVPHLHQIPLTFPRQPTAILNRGPDAKGQAWIGTAMPTMVGAGLVIEESIYDALCEEAPRIWGSTERLDASRRRF